MCAVQTVPVVRVHHVGRSDRDVPAVLTKPGQRLEGVWDLRFPVHGRVSVVIFILLVHRVSRHGQPSVLGERLCIVLIVRFPAKGEHS